MFLMYIHVQYFFHNALTLRFSIAVVAVNTTCPILFYCGKKNPTMESLSVSLPLCGLIVIKKTG